MECPQCMSDMGKDDCIILNKCIQSHVQAARQYYEQAAKIMKKSGFVGGNADTYLYVKKSEKGKVCVALYIDDNLMIGDIKAIDLIIAAQQVLKVMEWLKTTGHVK